MVDEGELRASWSISSTSSDDAESDAADDNAKPQIGRSTAYTATRVFYGNRSDRQLQKVSPNVVSSDSELNHNRQEDIKPTGQSRTTDRNYKNNGYSPNVKKSAKFKSDNAAGSKRADTVDKRDSYKHSERERHNLSRETSKQQSRNPTNGGYTDNDKSKRRNETEQKQASPKIGGRENDSTEKDGNSATRADNMRYSRNRRSPRKWQILPIPPPPYRRPNEQTSVVTDDRRPYRRNLPPRMLAKLQQTSSTSAADAATDDPATITSRDGSKDPNDEVTHTTTDVRNDEPVQQDEVKEEVVGSPKVSTNVWKERQEFYNSARPKNEDEESYMLQLALEESQRQEEMKIREQLMWQSSISQLSLQEFQAPQCEELSSTDDVHSLLLDQDEFLVQNNGTLAKQTVETASQNNVSSSATEFTVLGQLDSIARSPHLCQKNGLGTDAFGLREMYCVAPGFKSYTTESGDIDTNLLNVQPPTGMSLFPPGVKDITQCYSSPFQQDASLPLQNTFYDRTAMSSDTTSYHYQNQNTLFPLSLNSDQSATSLSSTDPSVTKNTTLTGQCSIGSTVPYQHSVSRWTVDSNNTMPFTMLHTADGSKAGHEYNKDSGFRSHHQLFPIDILPPVASVFDKNMPNTGSYVPPAGTIGETKPVGFVPAVKGTTFKNEAATAMEAENVGEDGQDVSAASRLTTMARVQPSSTVEPQQQTAASNAKSETNDTAVHNSETGDKTTKDSTQPPCMPGYPAPWPMPPYPGGPFPYPFYPPWPYCPPMPMMPMMPHPMMPMVPMPYWMPPMHPAMQMRPPTTAESAADANGKPGIVSETKPRITD